MTFTTLSLEADRKRLLAENARLRAEMDALRRVPRSARLASEVAPRGWGSKTEPLEDGKPRGSPAMATHARAGTDARVVRRSAPAPAARAPGASLVGPEVASAMAKRTRPSPGACDGRAHPGSTCGSGAHTCKKQRSPQAQAPA